MYLMLKYYLYPWSFSCSVQSAYSILYMYDGLFVDFDFDFLEDNSEIESNQIEPKFFPTPFLKTFSRIFVTNNCFVYNLFLWIEFK